MRSFTLSPIGICLVSALAFAQVPPPSEFQLQGRLTDNAGQPVTSTTRDLRVEFYDSAVGGLLLGTSTVVDPPITNGIYAVGLAIPAGLYANNASVFLEMAVGVGAAGADGTFEVLSPRTRVLASAYALNADTLDGLDSSAFATATNAFFQGGNAFGGLATLGTSDAFDLVLETAGVERMRVLGSGAGAGRVGIGTTTPSDALQVVGQTRSSSFASADGTAGLPAYRFDGDTDVGMFRPAANTLAFTTGGSERVTIGPAGEVSLQGNTVTFTNPFGSGTVSTVANAAMTITSAGAGTLFLNAGATGATRMQTGGADRLYIENNGNVGISTTTPSYRLDVNGPARAVDGVRGPLFFSSTTAPGGTWAHPGPAGTWVAIPGMSLTFNVGVPSTLDIVFTGLVSNNALDSATYTQIYVDGAPAIDGAGDQLLGGYRNPSAGTTLQGGQAANNFVLSVGAGAHTVDVRCMVDVFGAGSGVWSGFLRVMAFPQ